MLYQSTFSLPAVPFLRVSQPQPSMHISTPTVQHILFHLLNRIIFSSVHTLWSSSLCNSLQYPVAFSLLGTNISSSPYSQTLFAYVRPSICKTKFQTHSTQQTNYKFNIHGSVHRNNILIQKSQQDAHVTCAPEDGWQWYPKHAEQSSDKINSVTCASCWDFCIRQITVLHVLIYTFSTAHFYAAIFSCILCTRHVRTLCLFSIYFQIHLLTCD
jgi:hypothetical protein